MELAVQIFKKGKDIRESKAMRHVGGYCLALDLTAVNLQAEAKKAGLPWTVCKGYDGSLPLSSYVDKEMLTDPHDIQFQLHINGELRQTGYTAKMHFKIPQLISYVSTFFTLNKGDLILTGTPAGAGLLKPKDKLEASIIRGEEIIFRSKFHVA